MTVDRSHAPIPDLRIIPTEAVHAHEDSDSQRALPLIERLQQEAYVINPPIVAPMGSDQFVILDGANRCHAFQHLNYPHILVQVVSYDGGSVELETWNHVIGAWSADAFLQRLDELKEIELHEGQDAHAIMHIVLRDERVIAVRTPVESAHERNAALRHIVAIYQQNAHLHRTTINEPQDIWKLYPDAAALVIFPHYQPADITAAARYKAYLPPGVSRHVVYGRALRINYPLADLIDETVSLTEKNARLQDWLRTKLARRQVRFYAESTYQFDE